MMTDVYYTTSYKQNIALFRNFEKNQAHNSRLKDTWNKL